MGSEDRDGVDSEQPRVREQRRLWSLAGADRSIDPAHLLARGRGCGQVRRTDRGGGCHYWGLTCRRGARPRPGRERDVSLQAFAAAARDPRVHARPISRSSPRARPGQAARGGVGEASQAHTRPCRLNWGRARARTHRRHLSGCTVCCARLAQPGPAQLRDN